MAILSDYTNAKGLSKAKCYIRVDAVSTDRCNGNGAVAMGVYADEATANPEDTEEGHPVSPNRIDMIQLPAATADVAALMDMTTAEVYAWVKEQDATLKAGTKVGE